MLEPGIRKNSSTRRVNEWLKIPIRDQFQNLTKDEETPAKLLDPQRRRRSPDPAQGNALGTAQPISLTNAEGVRENQMQNFDDALILAVFANSYRVLCSYTLPFCPGRCPGL